MNKKTGPIGMAPGAAGIRLAQVRRGWSGAFSVAFARLSGGWGDLAGSSAEEEAADRLKLQLSLRQDLGLPFRGKATVVAVQEATERLAFRRLRLAPMPPEERAEASHWQLARELGASPQELTSGIYPLGDVQEGERVRHEVMAVSACTSELETLAMKLEVAGWLPVGMEDPLGALSRVLGQEISSAPRLLLLVGEWQTSWVAVLRSGRPLLVHPLRLGRQAWAQRAALLTGSDAGQEDALISGFRAEGAAESRSPLQSVLPLISREWAHETVLCLRHLGLERQSEPMQAAVVGAGCLSAPLERELQQAFEGVQHGLPDGLKLRMEPLEAQLPAWGLRLLRNIPSGEPLDEWLLPLGLALHGMTVDAREAA